LYFLNIPGTIWLNPRNCLWKARKLLCGVEFGGGIAQIPVQMARRSGVSPVIQG
jgi:hypothetical protein